MDLGRLLRCSLRMHNLSPPFLSSQINFSPPFKRPHPPQIIPPSHLCLNFSPPPLLRPSLTSPPSVASRLVLRPSPSASPRSSHQPTLEFGLCRRSPPRPLRQPCRRPSSAASARPRPPTSLPSSPPLPRAHPFFSFQNKSQPPSSPPLPDLAACPRRPPLPPSSPPHSPRLAHPLRCSPRPRSSPLSSTIVAANSPRPHDSLELPSTTSPRTILNSSTSPPSRLATFSLIF